VDEAERQRQAETRQRLDQVNAATAQRLREAGEDREGIAAAARLFLDEALAVLFHPSALWFEWSKALRLAGFDAKQTDRRMRIYGTVSHERFGRGRPLPPDWPWFEHGAPE
jgi:hypothetical protein